MTKKIIAEIKRLQEEIDLLRSQLSLLKRYDTGKYNQARANIARKFELIKLLSR